MSETNKEEYKINGDMLLKKIKELIHEGNIRKITIKDREGHIIITLPLTVGVVGAMLAPALAAVGAVAALLTECSILVERASDKDKDKNE